MKKIFAILAVAAAVSASSAMADVTVFGTMDAGYNSVKAPGATSATTSFASGGMTTSNIGFKGSEDIGGGNKTVFELSSFINGGTGAVQGGSTVNTFARSAFVGISNGQTGTITLGRQSNPSFLPTILFNAYGDSGTYGPLWHATYFGNTGNPTTQTFNDTAWDNSIAYTTPSIGGATVSVQQAKGSTAGTNSGANVLYFNGPVGLTAYWQKTEFNSSGSFQTDIFTTNGYKPAVAKGIGASYDAKVAKVFATWSEGRDKTTSQDGRTTQVSALIPAGPGSIMAEVARTKYDNGSAFTTYNEWAVGYDYNLGKKTDVYATIGRTDVSGLAQGSTVGGGLRVRF